MLRHWRTSGSSWTKSVWSPICRPFVRRQFEEVLLDLGWEKVPNSECLIVQRKHWLFLSRTWIILKWLEKNRIWILFGRNWWNLLILTSQLHFLITYIWDVLNVNGNRMKSYWGIYKNVWITYFCWSTWKNYQVGETLRKDGRMVVRHGRTCSKMRWEMLRTGEQKDRAVIQSLKALIGWSSCYGGTWISWRIVRSMCSQSV